MDATRKVARDHPIPALFTSAALLRLVLAVAFPTLPDLLTGRVEISTPVTSFKRLQEGLFLYNHGLDPYDGGVFHQAPLLLPLFSLLPDPATHLGRIASMLLYTGVDLLSAIYLFDIASTQAATVSRSYSSPRKSLSWNPLSVAAVYLFDPLTILTCLARSTSVFTTMLTLLSVIKACQAKATASIFALAMASSLGLHPILLAPPIGVLCYDRIQQRHASRSKSDSRNTAPPGAIAFTFRLAVTFGAITALLLLISRTLVPSWSFLESVYATPLTLPDLTPNTGLWWYFFIEMFDPFRSFFLGVFWLHMLSYSVPLCLRFQKQPLAAVVIMVGVIAVFEPYASAGDAGVFLSVLCLLSHTFELNKYTYPAVATLIYVFFLGPAFHHLWIYAGSGNANFFYAITLVWNLGLLVLLTDAIYSVLRDEWEVMRPEMKGKSVARI